uniref:Col_cuticle_N domain-containing protein n=1 Tax=Heterorhabditis bacteriophora TaxID=37862 RepID=A0A1I7XFH5_HETBA
MHSNLHSYYGKAPPKVVSRPPSTIPMVPGMASDYVQPPSTFIPPTIPMGPHPRNDREIVNWNTLSLVCSMQVRETISLNVDNKCKISAKTIYKTKKLLISKIMTIIGLFPTIPWTFTEAIPATWMNENEPLELDFGLSLVILIQVLLSLIIVVAACRSFDVISTTLEDIKLQYDLQQAFHDHGEIPQKA